jgi:hypothetical protein
MDAPHTPLGETEEMHLTAFYCPYICVHILGMNWFCRKMFRNETGITYTAVDFSHDPMPRVVHSQQIAV